MKLNNLAIVILVILISGCSVSNNSAAVTNSSNLSENTAETIIVTPDEYTFYVTVPDNTPSADSINITFFSDVDWQLWKPMTRINSTYWVYSMPAGWLPTGATTISYGYSRNGDLSKTELLDLNNDSVWINRSFSSNREYGFTAYDLVNSWKDIVTIIPGQLITGQIYAIVPYGTDYVIYKSGDSSSYMSKINDYYYSISDNKGYKAGFTLTAYYSNGTEINSKEFLFDTEVFAYIPEPGIGRELMKGYGFTACHYCEISFTKGNYLEHLNSSYDLMKADGATWVVFNPVWFMTDIHANELRPIYREEYGLDGWSGWMYSTMPDNEVRLMIKWAHDRGLKVFIMPYLSTLNWSETVYGKGHVSPTNVDAFFDSYTNFITHYASIAEDEGVELLSIGNELDSITDETNTLSTGYNKTQKWYDIISAVREVYNGSLTYSCSCSHNDNNPCMPEKITFWDRLDYIGFEWYIPLTDDINASLPELIVDAREIINNKIKPLSDKFGGKPVLFTEYGWEAKPYVWTKTYLGGGQGGFDKYAAVTAYEAVYQAMRNEPVTVGMFPGWPLGNEEDMPWIKDYNGGDVRFSIIESEIAKWYSYYR